MKKFIFNVIAIFLLFSCANTKPLRSLENNPMESGLNEKQIDSVFLNAGRSEGWVIQKDKNEKNSFIGKIYVRNHYVEVFIGIEKNSFTVTYKDSRNMGYDESMNQIHRNYYRWVTNLIADINRGLSLESAGK